MDLGGALYICFKKIAVWLIERGGGSELRAEVRDFLAPYHITHSLDPKLLEFEL